jgi:hypothetical protein
LDVAAFTTGGQLAKEFGLMRTPHQTEESLNSNQLPLVTPNELAKVKFAGRGVGKRQKGRRLPNPTNALPGTAEKVAVLAARFRSGQRLWHPRDARLECSLSEACGVGAV